jgi:hypothetical protein
MQDEAVLDERDLRVDDLVEEVALALRKDLEPRLTRELRIEMRVIARDGEEDVRCELVAAGVVIEELRIIFTSFRVFGGCSSGAPARRCRPMSSTPAFVEVFESTTTPI